MEKILCTQGVHMNYIKERIYNLQVNLHHYFPKCGITRKMISKTGISTQQMRLPTPIKVSVPFLPCCHIKPMEAKFHSKEFPGLPNQFLRTRSDPTTPLSITQLKGEKTDENSKPNKYQNKLTIQMNTSFNSLNIGTLFLTI